MSCPYDNGSGSAPHPLPPTTPTEIVPIPQPPQYLFGLLGNYPDIDPSFPAKSMWQLASLYGPIVKLNLAKPVVIISNQKLINEVCDETRFEKYPNVALQQIRALLGDGLFTAFPEEKNWWKAHRTLVPAFGPLGIMKMFDAMLDISSQMVLKWDRLGPDHEIDCSDDLTRLAFDTIGLCAFGYRFNEFYGEKWPMSYLSRVSVPNRTTIVNQLYRRDEEARQENVRKMHQVADEIIAERGRNPQPDAKDLLDIMMNNADRETGEKLSDENIRFNMCTFLVAGHETTSSTLSFCYLNLLSNPEKLHKAQQQVDQVVGDGVLEYKHLARLTYIDACLKETLRVMGPISAIVLHPKEDTFLDGKYPVTKDTFIQANLRGLHHDIEVWGDDHDEFRPERMLDGGFQALPPNSWKPFGNGMRACIGRTFAEQEMVMNIALVLQRFQIELADPTYKLQLKSTLTVKPWHFKMKVRRRQGKTMMTGIPGGIPAEIATKQKDHSQTSPSAKNEGSKKTPFTVYFGGNTGTCESLAQDLEVKASEYGLQATIQSLDSATEHLPTDQLVVIITSSYEGKPPDNGKKFVSWLEHLNKSNQLKDVKYTVFGVGNSDWASTFHKIPKLVDATMAKLGAASFVESGFTNVKTDVVGPWEDWLEKFFGAISEVTGGTGQAQTTTLSVSVEKKKDEEVSKATDETFGTVLVNRELAGTEVGPAKRHMEVRLPAGPTYTAGDYLVVQPRNPDEVVNRILSHFSLSSNDIINISDSKKKFLPTTPVSASEFFSTAVELNTPITKRQLDVLIASASPSQKEKISGLKDDGTYAALLQKRYSILNTLSEYQVDLPLASYIDMLLPLSSRQYSISSSPFHPTSNPTNEAHADVASITYDVLTAPALSGHGTFHGVASTYLSTRRPGDPITCSVRVTNVAFHLPSNHETPVIMIAAGTGIAPMRAFLQERAAIAAAGVKRLGPALLFFGCRDEMKDFIYKEELVAWQDSGVVDVKMAFSKGEKGRYVQDVIWEERESVRDLFRTGGKILLCGSAAKLGKGASEVCKKIYREGTGRSEEEANEWLESIKEDRYVSDVFD